ncbi:MAG: 1-deoxy-D-xylulose-5-phosphate synthase [Oscillospiraceae bacterium]
MRYRILDTIKSPKDIKALEFPKLALLCREIREYLIETISATGGHLSSNLGVVELTVALHRVFNSPQDEFVFDVGHQCYVHKIVTGRREELSTIRKEGGLSGFPCPEESEHDIFSAGHGSTSISAAVGLAQAKKIRGEAGYVVAVVGDGAFTGGMIYEAMNNVSNLDNLIIILNDNKMSISKNAGALSQYFTHLRSSKQYRNAKNEVKSVLEKTPLIGDGIKKTIQSVKAGMRRSIYHSTFFEDMGLRYVGPVDGHDLRELCALFENIPNLHRPVLVMIETIKGKGFAPAESNPGAFHGVSAFDLKAVTDPEVSSEDSFSSTFGRTLAALGSTRKDICAITAAMKYGTGLQHFKRAHCNRFFDVGMAEEHAVTFAAGLARGGMLPVTAIYSTFLQRGYDQIIHDVVLQGLNVLFAVDRAGLVPADGATHQGIYDAAYFSQQSAMPVVSPANYAELEYWLEKLVDDYSVPRAIRYPRGSQSDAMADKKCNGNHYDRIVKSKDAKLALVSYGGLLEEVIGAAQLLKKKKIPCDVYQMVWINPMPQQLLADLMQYDVVLFAEDTVKQGGIGEHVAAGLMELGYKGHFVHKAITEPKIDHATVAQLRSQLGLNAALLSQLAEEAL